MTIGQELDALAATVSQNSADISALKSAVAALQPASTPPPTPTDVITIKPVPNINFTFGLPASFSLAGFASSSLGLALTLALSGALPPGVTFDSVAHLVGIAYYPAVLKGKAHALLIEPMWHPKSPISYGQAKNSGFDAVQLSEYARQWGFLGNRLGVFVALLGAIAQPKQSEKLIAHLLRLLDSPNGQTGATQKQQKTPSQGKP